MPANEEVRVSGVASQITEQTEVAGGRDSGSNAQDNSGNKVIGLFSKSHDLP